MNKERRQVERYEISIPCIVTHESEPIKGRITDFSMGGLFITELTGLIPPEGAVITVHCQMEDLELEIKAIVARSLSIHSALIDCA